MQSLPVADIRRIRNELPAFLAQFGFGDRVAPVHNVENCAAMRVQTKVYVNII